MHCSPPGSSVHGILQARILEWVAIPSLWDHLDPGIEPRSPALQADSLLSEPPWMIDYVPGTFQNILYTLTPSSLITTLRALLLLSQAVTKQRR